MSQQLNDALKNLGLKPNAIKVYLALTKLGEAPASQVAKKAELPRTTAISLLEGLESENLVSTHKYRGKTFYWIESPKHLEQALENKIEIAKGLSSLLSDIYHAESDFPQGKIFDSKAGIKKFIEKTLIELKPKSTIYTIDSPGKGNYDKILSDDFGQTMLGLKNKKGVQTKTLVPQGTKAGIDPRKLTLQKIEIRELPGPIHFEASLWLIEDTFVLFSSNYPFVLAGKHKIITASLKSLYDYLWAISQ